VLNSHVDNWYPTVLAGILDHGHEVAPRGQRVKELLGVSFTVANARENILLNDARKLNYRYLVAEWLWIAFGRNEVSLLTPYNSQMARFSDDGILLAGAYGPRLGSQWSYVIETLKADPDSRQAVASIWTPVPVPSRDIPCTIALQFFIRFGRLETIATMRSSDAWLGLPYDVFVFSQLANCLAGELGIDVGSLRMQLGSSHLYQDHWSKAQAAVQAPTSYAASPALPGFPPAWLEEVLEHRTSPVQLLFESAWERYAVALRMPTWSAALAALRSGGSTEGRLAA
jgi:thymidylate synthase